MHGNKMHVTAHRHVLERLLHVYFTTYIAVLKGLEGENIYPFVVDDSNAFLIGYVIVASVETIYSEHI